MAEKNYSHGDKSFVWDENKNNSNKNKHDISFEDATLAFDDNNSIDISSTQSCGENRWLKIAQIMASFIKHKK